MIIGSLLVMIDNAKSLLSSNSLEKTIKQLEKTLEKLKKKRDKETDPEKKKELDKLIAKTEKQIKELKSEKQKADREKRLHYELKIANYVKDMLKSDRWDEWHDEYRNEYCFGLAIAISNIPSNKIKAKMGNGKSDDSTDCIGLCEDDQPELFHQFQKHFKMKDEKDVCLNIFFAIDDTLFVYGTRTNSFYFGDWSSDEKCFYTVEQLKALGQKLMKDPKYIEAFSEIGMEI